MKGALLIFLFKYVHGRKISFSKKQNKNWGLHKTVFLCYCEESVLMSYTGNQHNSGSGDKVPKTMKSHKCLRLISQLEKLLFSHSGLQESKDVE